MGLTLIHELKGHEDRVWQISWHPTQEVMASCGGDRAVRIWKRDSPNGGWSCVSILDNAHKRTIRSVAYAPSGSMLASASFDATTAIWEKQGEDFDCAATLEGHENEVKCVAWSSSGALLATCGRDKNMGDADFECISVLQEHTQDVKHVAWHPSEEVLVSSSYDDTIRIWRDDEDDWYSAATLTGHKSTVWASDFNSDGNKLVSVSDDKSIKLWTRDPATSKNGKDSWSCTYTLDDAHTRSIYSVSWSKRHNTIATAGGDNMIKLLEPVRKITLL
ncbi:hypothetical protein HDU76_004343 [Blyttiomyces sp. JEL0837]|nr:hypothetical protein HDU76_004343 [Blyttiomyces sp. JEL0837]